ncbi:MAG: fumarylacetoacetate hydrolase family protein [Psychrobium sp.]|nr:fumarylacetoacetate hydrolase family protein [Psychrobium sp.]
MNSVICNGKNIIPSKIICVGRNYAAHISELNNEVPDELVVFCKTNSAISTQLQSFSQEPLHYEGEICFIFQGGRFSSVGFGIDLTKRALQSTLKDKGLPWERAKSFDASAVFSHFVTIPQSDEELTLSLSIDKQLVQEGGESLMLHKPDIILAQLQSFMTLEDGDIVMTGTPKGVGEIVAGSTFSGNIKQGLTTLVTQNWIAQ